MRVNAVKRPSGRVRTPVTAAPGPARLAADRRERGPADAAPVLVGQPPADPDALPVRGRDAAAPQDRAGAARPGSSHARSRAPLARVAAVRHVTAARERVRRERSPAGSRRRPERPPGPRRARSPAPAPVPSAPVPGPGGVSGRGRLPRARSRRRRCGVAGGVGDHEPQPARRRRARGGCRRRACRAGACGHGGRRSSRARLGGLDRADGDAAERDRTRRTPESPSRRDDLERHDAGARAARDAAAPPADADGSPDSSSSSVTPRTSSRYPGQVHQPGPLAVEQQTIEARARASRRAAPAGAAPGAVPSPATGVEQPRAARAHGSGTPGWCSLSAG